MRRSLLFATLYELSIIFRKESLINAKKVLNFTESLINEKKVIMSLTAFQTCSCIQLINLRTRCSMNDKNATKIKQLVQNNLLKMQETHYNLDRIKYHLD